MEQLKLYFRESYNELVNHVTWPTIPNLYRTTIVVVVATILITFIIFLMNAVFKGLLDFIYGLN